MEVEFGERIEITLSTKDSDEYYVAQMAWADSLCHDATNQTFITMPLDRAIELHEKLGQVIKQAKAELNEKIARENLEVTANEVANVMDGLVRK